MDTPQEDTPTHPVEVDEVDRLFFGGDGADDHAIAERVAQHDQITGPVIACIIP